MGAFVARVRPRWSDMDVFGHVNHASTVTLFEEARVALLFGEAARQGLDKMAAGIVVAKLAVDYHSPLHVDGGPVRVEISVRQLRSASFTVDHAIYNGVSESDAVVATAETLLVPYDTLIGRPRRLTEAERNFLACYRIGGDDA
jgi:acyl-CoA thioester hydrolase